MFIFPLKNLARKELSLMMHICVNEMGQQLFQYWLRASEAAMENM